MISGKDRAVYKKMTLDHVRRVWAKTNERITQSVDTYIDDLYEKEKKRSS